MLIREMLRVGWLRELQDLAVHERNRNRFGELRTRLVAMAREERIDLRSPHFAVLYRVLTLLMRNPHDYDKAARAVLEWEPKTSELSEHAATPDEAELLLDFARRMDLLCRDYSRTYRSLVGAIDWVRRRFGDDNRIPFLVFVYIGKHSRSMQRVTPVREASKKLETLGRRMLAAA